MGELIQSKCGVVVTRTLHDAHSMIDALKHRGPDMTGIAAIGDTIDVVRWLGKPNRFEVHDLEALLQGSNYHTYMAHCRYRTAGGDDLLHAQPQVIGGTRYHNGSHIIIRDCDAAMVHNGQVDPYFMPGIANELLKTTSDTEHLLHYALKFGPQETLKSVPAAYTLAYARKGDHNVIVLRDQTGIRPGHIFKKDGKSGMASEDHAIADNGGRKIEEINRGSMTTFYANGKHTTVDVVEPKEAYCFFELAYLLHPLSHYVGREAHHARRRYGKVLAEQMMANDQVPPDALVTYIPRCAEPMAEKFAEEADRPFAQLFYKMRSDRSFLEATQEKRDKSIGENLHMIPEWQTKVEDRPIIIVDDSIVRGTNLKRPRDLLLEAGVSAHNIILASAVPPLGIVNSAGAETGCRWGVDMPPGKDFIARGRTLHQISEHAGVRVVYLTPQSHAKVFDDLGLEDKRMCTYCTGGRAPYELTINHTS